MTVPAVVPRWSAACEKAHRFAVEHVKRHAKPNPDAFFDEAEQLSVQMKADGATELECMIAFRYAEAALRYGRKYRGEGGLWHKESTQSVTERARRQEAGAELKRMVQVAKQPEQ